MRKFEKKIKIYLQFSILYLIFQCKKILYEFPIFKIERNTIESNKQDSINVFFFFMKINKELKIEFLNSKLAK